MTQRNRVNINYTTRKLKLYGALQEIHLWGVDKKFSAVGSINAFELYAEPSLGKDWKLRVGRQAISLDNGRIFSAAPWGQQGRSHEGIRLLFHNKLESDLIFAFTRNYYEPFDRAYSPVAAHQYKYLWVHHLKSKLGAGFTLTTINAADVFKNAVSNNHYARITNGGRLEWISAPFYASFSGYYQHGQTNAQKTIQAWYIQPELALNSKKQTTRLGFELLSGERENAPDKDYSFVPLYGVAWKFMGNMNLYARFPTDVGRHGLFNPYLFLIRRINSKLSLRLDGHLFYSQHALTDSNGGKQPKFLGVEMDGSLNYKPTRQLDIHYGLSFYFPQDNTSLLGKIPNTAATPVWSYLMISYQPGLFEKRWR